jgi:DNA-binding transcriptional regulator YiaG
MMTDEQKSKVAELKAVIAATGPTREGAPQEVRVAAMALKRDLRRTGTTARVLAAALGVHESTLCRWERDEGAESGRAAPTKKGRGRRGSFRMVKVTTPVATPRVTPTSSATAHGLRAAHAPSGLVIDGLDVETLAALLRRLS